MQSTRLPWEADRELTLEFVREAVIEQAPPGSDPDDIAFVGSGWDNDIYSSGDVYLRFPRRADVVDAGQREARFLKRLENVFPFEVPRYVFEGHPTANFPYVWTAFIPVRGRRWDALDYGAGQKEALCKDLGKALTALHSFEIREARELGLEDNRETPAIWLDGLKAQAKTIRRVLPRTTLKRWEPFLAGDFEVPGCPDDVRVIHNDLGGPHIRVDPETRRLLGFIDFGDIVIGDPTIDFVGLYMQCGLGWVRELVKRYPYSLPDDWEHRVAFYGRVLALKWIAEAAAAGPDELASRLEWFVREFEPLTQAESDY